MSHNGGSTSASATPSRYQRVKMILDAAAGDSQANYQGYGRFWNLPLPEFLTVVIYGIRMIAPGEEGPPPRNQGGSPAAESHAGSCCHTEPPPPSAPAVPSPKKRFPGRGAKSGLIIGLRGAWPFDGSRFPRLPWGGSAVAPADIQFISDWIDDDCPEQDKPEVLDRLQTANLAAGITPHAVVSEATNALKEQAGHLKQRQNVLHLSESELSTLRYAIQELQNLNAWPRDMRNYNSWAQLHGDECPHGWSTFLPWHRMYLWGFEHALQDIVPEITLPYWNWAQSTPEQVRDGYIPEAFRCWVSDQMLSNLSGKVSPETLKKLATTQGNTFTSITKFWQATGPIPEAEQPVIIAQLKLVNPLWYDLRYPGEFSDGTLASLFHHHYPTPDDMTRILAVDNWRDFGGGMDVDQSFGVLDMDPHNTMHIWIGGFPAPGQNGDMANNLTAAFDPIFWAHHSNIDRVWAQWQTLHPHVNPPDPSDVLPGVNATVQDSLYIQKLGYEYAADTYIFPTQRSLEIQKFTSAPAGVRAPVLANHRRAEVRLHGIQQPLPSFLVRVFLNLPEADVNTSIDNNDHYAGHFSLFGHGPCIGGPGHCDPRPLPRRKFDTRPPHHNEPWNLRMDVTKTVQKLVEKGATDLQVKLVVISPEGKAGVGSLRLDSVSLTFED